MSDYNSEILEALKEGDWKVIANKMTQLHNFLYNLDNNYQNYVKRHPKPLEKGKARKKSTKKKKKKKKKPTKGSGKKKPTKKAKGATKKRKTTDPQSLYEKILDADNARPLFRQRTFPENRPPEKSGGYQYIQKYGRDAWQALMNEHQAVKQTRRQRATSPVVMSVEMMDRGKNTPMEDARLTDLSRGYQVTDDEAMARALAVEQLRNARASALQPDLTTVPARPPRTALSAQPEQQALAHAALRDAEARLDVEAEGEEGE